MTSHAHQHTEADEADRPARAAGANPREEKPRVLADAGNAAVARLLVRRRELASQGAGPLDAEIATAIEAEHGGGAPLSDPVRADMESHFGVNLSAVRVHTGPSATELNRAVQAEAFTTGPDVFLRGNLDANSSAGRELLAHELTHVVQQATGSTDLAGTVSSPDDPTELAAREVGRAVAGAAPLQRYTDDFDESAITPPSAGAPIYRHTRSGVIDRAPAGPQESAAAAQQSANEARQTADRAAGAATTAQITANAAGRSAADALAAANAAMNEARLADLRGVARSHIGLAFTEWVSACHDVRDSIKAAAKQNAELMAMVLDIAMGFAAPGLARGLAGWADRLPVAATTLEYRVAMAALNTDAVKAMFAGATKASGQLLKSNALMLAGETETDAFLGDLELRTHVAFQALGDDLGNQDAAHAGVVAAMFDASVANRNTYREQIRHVTDMFELQVAPIGEPVLMSENFAAEAVWVRLGATTRLALVEYKPGFLGVWGNRYWLHQWITPEMQHLAVAKQVSKYGRVNTIEQGELAGQ